MKILSGRAHRELATRIADFLGEPLTGVDIHDFPDGEVCVQIMDNIRGRDVFIVQPTCPPDPNKNLMELLIMIDAARRASAQRITAVIPYFGYARQDRKDKPRVPITAKLVASLLTTAGAQRVLTLDLHSQQIQGFFDIPVDHLTAAPVMVKALRARALPNMVVVAPDTGGVKTAYAYAKMLECGFAIAAKQRKNEKVVEPLGVVGEVRGRDVILIDDLVSTAGTLQGAASQLKPHAPRSIRAVVTHSMVNDVGVKNLKESGIEEILITDSLPVGDYGGFPVSVQSVAELLGDAILRIHNNQSVTTLFQV